MLHLHLSSVEIQGAKRATSIGPYARATLETKAMDVDDMEQV